MLLCTIRITYECLEEDRQNDIVMGSIPSFEVFIGNKHVCALHDLSKIYKMESTNIRLIFCECWKKLNIEELKSIMIYWVSLC
jgi:hypothetical protein